MPEFANTWMPFIYLYGVGGIFFIIGIYLIISTKALNAKKKEHKRWLSILVFGFLYYAVIHGVLILLALDININWVVKFLVLFGLFIYFNRRLENRLTVLEQSLEDLNDSVSQFFQKNIKD